jgi:hypothetical protein
MVGTLSECSARWNGVTFVVIYLEVVLMTVLDVTLLRIM